jgi:Zn-dependent protease with chaperone function
VKPARVVSLVAPLLPALAAAEAGRRLLAPRELPPAPEPVDLLEHFSIEQLARGRRYGSGQMALALARAAVNLAALSAVVRRPARRSSPDGQDAGWRRRALADAAAGAGLAVAMSLPGLPLAALSRRRSLKVGLATQSWHDWGIDLVKARAIEALLAAGAGAGVTAVTRRWPRAWWLPVAGGASLVTGAFATLAPVLLDPVFNEFTPLEQGETRADVLALAEAAGVRVGEVFSIDASRRTSAANAYVTGLGPTKRVVLFDTLLGSYTRDEVRVVVAHELAHVAHRDVQRGVAFAALTSPALAFAVQRLSWTLSPARGTARALPALALATAAAMVPVSLVANRLSRALERAADAFSLELSGAPEAFVSFERRIAVQNVAYLDPPRALTALLSTHPPTGERIGAALAYQKRRAAPAS